MNSSTTHEWLVDLRTPRLRVREWTPSDAVALFGFESRPSVARWQPHPPKTLEACQRHIERAHAWALAEPRCVYDVAVEFEGRVAGRVGARVRPERVATLWYVVDPRRWRLGIATEACEGLISHLFDRHCIDEFRAKCSVHNTASARVAAKLGFIELASQSSRGEAGCGPCHVFRLRRHQSRAPLAVSATGPGSDARNSPASAAGLEG